MNKLEIHSDYGEIKVGPLRAHWYNSTGGEAGFFLLGWGNYNVEFGQVDQEYPGIYLTRYSNGDVEQVRTILELS